MRPTPRLILTFLGGFDARPATGAPLALPTRKARALLAYLALPLGRAHPREKLAALLWGDMPDAQARGNLRQALSRIHKAWAAAAVPGLRFQGDTVALDPASVEVDVAVFEHSLADGRPGALEQAAERYRGDLLEGLALSERAFDEWLAAERERLRERALEALGRLLTHQSTTGGDEQALRTARRLLELDPLQEAVHRLVMRLHWQAGHRAAALRQYQLCAEVLQRELRAEPEAATRQLHQEIMRPSPSRGADGETAPAPPPPEAVSGPATLVGREDEAARYRELLDEVGAGEGRVIALVGEAGIGKGRLLDALAVLAAERGFRVLPARSHETEQVLPFGPWVDALRAGGIADDPAVLGKLSPGLCRDLARLLPELGDGRRARALRANPAPAFRALAQLIAAAATLHPLVIVLDDFHWADEMSIRLLAFLGRRLGGSASLLAVSVCSEALTGSPLLRRTLDELSSEAQLAWIEIKPLSPDDTLRLLGQVVILPPDPEVRARFEAEAWRLAEGNPLVALETAGAWSGQGAPALPERVRHSIVDRLERLDDHARQLLGVAAVIGRDLDADLLLSASGLGDDAGVAGFESLLREGILLRDGEQLRFRHERVRDVGLDLLSAPRRVLIHRRIAEGLEAQSAPDRRLHREIGRHYHDAGVGDRALHHLRAAGRLAADRGAYRDAVACYTEALDAGRRVATRREIEVVSVDLQIELGASLHSLGDVERALDHYQTAETEAAALGDATRVAWAVVAMSYAQASLGRHPTAIDLARRVLASTAGDPRDPTLWIWARQSLVRASYAAGDYPAAVAVARATLDTQVVDVAPDPAGPPLLGPVLPAVGIRGLLALALSALGRFDDALAEGAEAVRLAEKIDRASELAWASYCLGHVELEQGDTDQAVEYLERAFALTREWEPAPRRAASAARPLAHLGAAALGLAHAATGRFAAAVDLVAGSVDVEQARAFCVAPVLEIRSRVLLVMERLDEATSAATAALETARARGERGREASTLRLLGEIAHRRQPPAVQPALAYLDHALALADQLQMRPLRALCALERAEILSEAGRRDEARRSLAPALDDFRAMDMTTACRRSAFLLENLRPRAGLRRRSSQEQDGS